MTVWVKLYRTWYYSAGLERLFPDGSLDLAASYTPSGQSSAPSSMAFGIVRGAVIGGNRMSRA